jgi:hypothetical protein
MSGAGGIDEMLDGLTVIRNRVRSISLMGG